jgi:2-iminobutanoate/2-iminopropanoate deaminase
MKNIINTNNAPAPIGPYSQAVFAGNLLFVSGQIPMHPETGELILADIKAQTTRVMENLKGILVQAGVGFDNIVKTSIFLTDMNDFAEVNQIYGTYFVSNFPARETVQVAALPKGVNVEISVIVVKP